MVLLLRSIRIFAVYAFLALGWIAVATLLFVAQFLRDYFRRVAVLGAGLLLLGLAGHVFQPPDCERDPLFYLRGTVLDCGVRP